jgi:hypothetical protein
MGKGIYTGNVPAGSVTTAGESRGWMKIQISRTSNGGYKIKYAPLNSASHKELTINKNSAYNYNFVSLKNEKELFIQPEKKKWDLCFYGIYQYHYRSRKLCVCRLYHHQ